MQPRESGSGNHVVSQEQPQALNGTYPAHGIKTVDQDSCRLALARLGSRRWRWANRLLLSCSYCKHDYVILLCPSLAVSRVVLSIHQAMIVYKSWSRGRWVRFYTLQVNNSIASTQEARLNLWVSLTLAPKDWQVLRYQHVPHVDQFKLITYEGFKGNIFLPC